MTDQLKPKAWLINDKSHCTGIEVACDERADVIEYWKEEGKAIPLYAIPEGFDLVPVEPIEAMLYPGSLVNGLGGDPDKKSQLRSECRAMIKAVQDNCGIRSSVKWPRRRRDMKITMTPGRKEYVKLLYQAFGEMAIEVTEEMPIISDLTIALKDHPEILNDIPGQDWRGKGKRKMRRLR